MLGWVLLFIFCTANAAERGVDETYAVHGQFTFVRQSTFGFNAPYAGPNSLTPNRSEETADLTVFLGAHLWSGAELWINPEIDQGFGLDNTLGVAGFPSGEAYKVGKSHPYLKLPRLFVRQTWGRGGDEESVVGAANQLGGVRNANRIVLTVGKFGVGDIFDLNRYAHDPRGDFLNWGAIDAGSFDYAADAWGYTEGAALEGYFGNWTARGGLFDLSDVPNSQHLEHGWHEFQMLLELEHRHRIAARSGKLALTAFESRGRMGLLDDAVSASIVSGTPIDIAAVRRFRGRFGAHLNIEQELTTDLGAFARFGKSAGNVEAYEFTDIDQSLALGVSLSGQRWTRSADTVGVVALINRISAARQRYLAAGGLGILVGDGQLPNSGPEQIIETFYNASVLRFAQLSIDYQWVNHPAYNRDRGPASIFGVRFHSQF